GLRQQRCKRYYPQAGACGRGLESACIRDAVSHDHLVHEAVLQQLRCASTKESMCCDCEYYSISSGTACLRSTQHRSAGSYHVIDYEGGRALDISGKQLSGYDTAAPALFHQCEAHGISRHTFHRLSHELGSLDAAAVRGNDRDRKFA